MVRFHISIIFIKQLMLIRRSRPGLIYSGQAQSTVEDFVDKNSLQLI